MGREVKRVPMDFNWPTGKVWGGYLNPFYSQTTDCPHCEHGYSPEYTALKNKWYGNVPFSPEENGSTPYTADCAVIRAMAERNCKGCNYPETEIPYEARRLARLFNQSWSHHLNDEDVAVLVAANRLYDFTHDWKRGDGWKPKDPPVIPTAREVNDWSLTGFGHDSCNAYCVITARLEKAGLPAGCSHCDGEGRLWPTPEIQAQYEAWQATEPPIGEGWQVWETVSEGSPVSPVFATPEELARWMTDNHGGIYEGTSYESWLAMIQGAGWSPSMVVTGGVLMNGVDAAAMLSEPETTN